MGTIARDRMVNGFHALLILLSEFSIKCLLILLLLYQPVLIWILFSSVLQENLESHVKRCPLLKQNVALSAQLFYQKGINAGNEEEEDCYSVFTSEMKRNLVYSMTVSKFHQLVKKIEAVHGVICNDIEDSHLSPEACNIWFNKEIDR